MWLFKKFLNTDIMGKIYITIILFIVIVAIITVITRYNNPNKADQKEKTNNDIAQVSQVGITGIDDLENETNNNNLENSILEENITTDNKEIQNSSIVKAETNIEENNNSKVGQSIKSDLKQVEQVVTNQVEKEVTKQEKVEKPVKEEVENSVPPITNTEEYRVNTAMIETMRNFINNNQSKDMKEYGFKVVVDSSIINDTNEFTFSEYRLKSKIEYKFGTIKIYAQDYFRNGQLIRTQCFII